MKWTQKVIKFMVGFPDHEMDPKSDQFHGRISDHEMGPGFNGFKFETLRKSINPGPGFGVQKGINFVVGFYDHEMGPKRDQFHGRICRP